MASGPLPGSRQGPASPAVHRPQGLMAASTWLAACPLTPLAGPHRSRAVPSACTTLGRTLRVPARPSALRHRVRRRSRGTRLPDIRLQRHGPPVGIGAIARVRPELRDRGRPYPFPAQNTSWRLTGNADALFLLGDCPATSAGAIRPCPLQILTVTGSGGRPAPPPDQLGHAGASAPLGLSARAMGASDAPHPAWRRRSWA